MEQPKPFRERKITHFDEKKRKERERKGQKTTKMMARQKQHGVASKYG